MESILTNPIFIPLGLFVMVIFIVGITAMRKMRERELQAHQELRIREMEHERKLKEMDIERAKLELEKAKAVKSV
jgi:Tfp pilus assembly protein PilV